MSESTNTIDLSQYHGKKVRIVAAPEGEGDAVELEGTAESATAAGILFRGKGKTKKDIIEPERIIEITLLADGEPKLKAKTLKPVVLGQAKSHLLERHGATLADVNGMTEDYAFGLHQDIDHVADDLGHVHGDKSETPAAQAVAEAESTDAA